MQATSFGIKSTAQERPNAKIQRPGDVRCPGSGSSGHFSRCPQSKPTKGNDQFTLEYQGATYRFASAANRDKFAADPATYAPQYGGYCAFGTAVGRKFDGDPTAWRIVDGKLYLNLNKNIQQRWLTDTPGFIRGADHNWPIIVSLTDGQLASNPPVGLTLGAT